MGNYSGKMILAFVVLILCCGVVLWIPELGLMSQGIKDIMMLGFMSLGIFALMRVFI